MNDGSPPEDPSGGAGFLDALMRTLRQGSPDGASAARTIAHSMANEGRSEPNVDPGERNTVSELARVAELQVAEVTGLSVASTSALRVEVLNRSQWADRTLADYRSLLGTLTQSMADAMQGSGADDDPMASMMRSLSGLLAPILSAVTTGSMVGNLARRALGGYELPVPRTTDHHDNTISILLPNVDRFADDWSLDRTDARLWVALHEVAHHAVLNVGHIREQIDRLLQYHASSFESDSDTLISRLGDFDPTAGPDGLSELQSMLTDPELVLGAVRSTRQEAIQPELTTIVAAVSGYVDHVMDRIGGGLIGTYRMLSEAMRRRRVDANAEDRFTERLLGLELDFACYDLGAAFASGVVERAGEAGLQRLFSNPTHLPTPAEIRAPGLWLARIDLEG